MNKKFTNILNETMEGGFQDGNFDPIPQAFQLVDDLNRTKEQIGELTQQIMGIVEHINAILASEIRKRQPNLPINLANGCCTCGYKSSSITIHPDLEKKQWNFDSNSRFARRFLRENGHLKNMDKIQTLAHAIADYFNDRYRSLRGGK